MKHSHEGISEDWTLEPLSPEQNTAFIYDVVSPSVRALYWEMNRKFLSVPKNGDELSGASLDLQINDNESSLLRASLKAEAKWETTAQKHEIVMGRQSTLILEERILDESLNPLFTPEGSLEVWKKTAYHFQTKGRSPIYVDSYPLFKRSSNELVQEEYTQSQINALKSMIDSEERSTLYKNDCIQIGGIFIFLGVSPPVMDILMGNFSKKLEKAPVE
jgi:hypothetical protein